MALLLVGGADACLAADEKVARSPNIVLMTADNLGYGDIGFMGNREVVTHHLDELARSGVICTSFYTASPTCTVSRASLLTGRYPQRHQLLDQLPGLEGNYGIGLRHSERLLPELMQEVGYRTACFGKWNIGFAPGSRPTERGFDEFFGHASGNIDYYSHVYNGQLDLHSGVNKVERVGYCTDLFADSACRFIQANRLRPFFLYLPFNAPHFPNAKNKRPGQAVEWQAPPEAFDPYSFSPSTTNAKHRYYAVITALDRAIGRVLKTLDDSGLAEQTLVIFYSDNGAFMLPERGLEVASNEPLRDGGVTLWEGGIRVPCVIRWPGKIPSGTTCEQALLSCDLFPLCVSAGGAKLPTERIIDGRDPLAALTRNISSPHPDLYFKYRKYQAIRSGDFKLLQTQPDGPWQLFNLAVDVGESNDLAEEMPQRAKRLAKRFQTWLEAATADRKVVD